MELCINNLEKISGGCVLVYMCPEQYPTLELPSCITACYPDDFIAKPYDIRPLLGFSQRVKDKMGIGYYDTYN